MFVSKSYTVYSEAEAKKIEQQLLKMKYHFYKKDGCYLYYEDIAGCFACIYLKFKTKEK